MFFCELETTLTRLIGLFLYSRLLYLHCKENSIYVFPEKKLARPHSQFLHLYICERFIYSHDRSTYFPAAK
jgi:hypothetical protein